MRHDEMCTSSQCHEMYTASCLAHLDADRSDRELQDAGAARVNLCGL